MDSDRIAKVLSALLVLGPATSSSKTSSEESCERVDTRSTSESSDSLTSSILIGPHRIGKLIYLQFAFMVDDMHAQNRVLRICCPTCGQVCPRRLVTRFKPPVPSIGFVPVGALRGGPDGTGRWDRASCSQLVGPLQLIGIESVPQRLTSK